MRSILFINQNILERQYKSKHRNHNNNKKNMKKSARGRRERRCFFVGYMSRVSGGYYNAKLITVYT